MRNVIVGTVFALALLVASPVMAQDFDKGWKACQSDDFATALKEWKPLVEQGNAIAPLNLGVMYGKGEGALQDTIAAHMWFNIAAADGHTDAEKNRDTVAGKLSSAGVEATQTRAERCMASGYKDCD